MLSLECLPVFIILVYVSGSTINDIEILSTLQVQNTKKTFITSTTTLATAITTPLLRTEKSTKKSTVSSSLLSSEILLDHGIKPTSVTSIISLIEKLPIETSPSSITTTTTLLRIFPLNGRTSILSTTTNPIVEDSSSRINNHNNVGIGYLNITSQAGTHAYLPCNVKQLVKKPVSWIRVRDGHILTVDQTTFIADQRFQSIYGQNPEHWSLQIKYVQSRDAGSYECQVSTEPKMSARVNLSVIEPKTELVGEPNRHVKAGSRVILRCIVSGALEPPLFVNWYFDKKQIYLHKQNSWRTEIDREFLGNNSDKQNTIASLIIPSVTKKDSGNYTCSPSNSESITFVLHVLNGEYSASAITSNADILKQSLTLIIIICLQLFIKI